MMKKPAKFSRCAKSIALIGTLSIGCLMLSGCVAYAGYGYGGPGYRHYNYHYHYHYHYYHHYQRRNVR